MASWTCYDCGFSVDTDNSTLFANIVDSHMSKCTASEQENNA